MKETSQPMWDNASFLSQLEIWGPAATRRAVSQAEAEAYCRALARTHYENFPVASWLLPRRLRQHFYNIYAYCRWADDLADETKNPDHARELLNWWRGQLEDCYGGSAFHPVFIALGPTIARFKIPRQPFDDLICAFEQDQRVREYETFDQLRDYCRRSADPVGRLVLYLAECLSEPNAAWSDSICTGLQLANFWQDVARDFDIGRVYIPRETRRLYGYGDDDLAHRRTNAAFRELMRFEVERARRFLLDGLPLVDCLPWRLRIDVDLFARGGLCILDQIEAIGYRVWETRPVVAKSDFVRLFFGSLVRGLLHPLRRRREPCAGQPEW